MLNNFKENHNFENNFEISNNYTSCIYCNIRADELLIQCGECDHKFCNGISEYINNSHILYHFEKSNHNTIKYPKKKFNEELYSDNNNLEIISCDYCNINNIFQLYFYKDVINKKIKFLCNNHLEKKIEEAKYLEQKFIRENYNKIVFSKNENDLKYYFISPSFIQFPSKLEDINLLNDCDKEIVKKNEEIIEQVDILTNKYLNKVKDKYESSDEYYNVYKPLILAEFNYAKKLYEMKPQFKIELNYSKNEDLFYFCIDDDFIDINFTIEKRLLFTQEPQIMDKLFDILDDYDDYRNIFPISFIGIIINIIPLKYENLKKIEILPINEDIENIRYNVGIYYIKENFCEIPFMRMLMGLENFINTKNNKNNVSHLIFSQILGICDEEQLKTLEENEIKEIFNENELITKIENYGELNTNQKKCLLKIFNHTLNMVQGPPGTGKTFLASFIIYNIFLKKRNNDDKILICAPSNSAADNLAQYLLNLKKALNPEKDEEKNLKILRVYPKAKELFENKSLQDISLHHKLKLSIEEYINIKLKEKEKENNNSNNLSNNNEEEEKENEEDDNNDNININSDENTFILRKNNLENKNEENKRNYDIKKEDKIIVNKNIVKRLEQFLINDHNIIISTCSTSYDEKLKDIKFKYILIDEATQSNEIETLLPIIHGSRYIVMIGDHRQLCPTVIYPKADLVGMKISLFERMIKLYPNNHFMLKKQYRMNPHLSFFPNDIFYEGKIKNSSRHEELENKYIKKIFKKFYFIKKNIPIMFINTNNKSTHKYNLINDDSNDKFKSESIVGKSYQNELEADITVKIINIFNSIKSLKKGKYNLGIITPYIGQKKLLLEKLVYQEKEGEKYYECLKSNIINIASVDSFQGKEKDFIIINTVRSNPKNMIGFLKDIRRLNVSITRAKHGLIIIGDGHCLSKATGEKNNKYSIWRYLIQYYQNLGVIVDYIDNEQGEKMFKPVKILDNDEKLKKYDINEYDFDGKNNKLYIDDEYNDIYEPIEKKDFNHYLDDFYFDNEFIYDNDRYQCEYFFEDDDGYNQYDYNYKYNNDYHNNEFNNVE